MGPPENCAEVSPFGAGRGDRPYSIKLRVPKLDRYYGISHLLIEQVEKLKGEYELQQKMKLEDEMEELRIQKEKEVKERKRF